MALKKLDFVLLKNRLGIVVGKDRDLVVPSDHIVVWFGDLAKDAPHSPAVYTVPDEYLIPGGPSVILC